MPQWLSYPVFTGPFSGQEQLLAASSTSPGAGMIRIPWSAVSGLITGTGFLPLTGGTLTGPLTLAGNATLPLQAVPLQQVTSIIGGPYLPLAGGTVTGATTFSADVTFSGAGTGLAVSNNATVGGTFVATGGINGTSVGAVTPSTGKFTNLTATGTVTIDGVVAPYLPTSSGVHSIAESGAVGDGVTDDQPAIQAWLNGLGAGAAEVLLVPGKFYYIGSAPLTIPNGVVIRGTYGALDNQLAVPGTFFDGGGFFINPALPVGIIMGAASALKSIKVYRSGLVAGASNAVATAAYAAWAAEAGYYQTNANMLAGATVIPLSNTAGISVGMQVSGPGPLAPGVPCTVLSIIPNTSVTISLPVTPAVASGAYYRFGPSIGISIPPSTGGVILRDLTVIGFRTGIQVIPGQYNLSYIHGDNITNLEWFAGGDTGSCDNCEFLPLYGNTTGNSSRPGDAIFVHDGPLGVSFFNVFSIGWLINWHFANALGGVCTSCNSESFDGAGTVNWWLENGSQATLNNCHAQAGATGFLIQNANNFTLSNCSSAGGPSVSGNNVAHFLIESTSAVAMTGNIIAPYTFANFPQKVPIAFSGANIAAVSVVEPVIKDMASGSAPTAPFIQGALPNPTTPNFAQGMTYHALGSGATLTSVWYWNGAVIDAGGTLATLTVVLPVQPMDKQVFELWFNIAITALTVSTTDGSFVGGFNAPAAGTGQRWLYNLSTATWYCQGTSSTFLPLAGGTVTGATTFSAAGTALTITNNMLVNGLLTAAGSALIGSASATTSALYMESAAGHSRYTIAYTGGTGAGNVRWQYGTDGGAESGGNAGSNYDIVAFDDSGTLVGTALSILRATMAATFAGPVRMNGTVGFNGTAPIAKPTVTGAKLPSDVVLASLLTALANYGLIIDSST